MSQCEIVDRLGRFRRTWRDHFKNNFYLITPLPLRCVYADPGPSTSSSSTDSKESTSRDKRPMINPTHYYQLPARKEAKIQALFEKLDANGDGIIDLTDLTKALHLHSPHVPQSYATRFLSRADLNDNEMIDFPEFMHYVLEHEKNVKVVFDSVDKNNDGVIDQSELRAYMKSIGIELSDEELAALYTRIDTDNSKSISLEEFQNYLLFCPEVSDAKVLVNYWRHNLNIDIGEDSIVPEDFTESEKAGGVVWRHLFSGGVAGSVSRTCTAPLDRLKVYMQVHSSGNVQLTMRSAMRAMYTEGGLWSFWRGNGVNVIKIAPETAIKFMSYEQVKRLIHRNREGDISGGERFVAGSLAGCMSQTCIYPLEVLKTRLALRRTGQMNKGLADAARTLYRKEGARCFFRGYVPNLLGIIPYAGIDLATYETLKQLYASTYGDEPGNFVVLACGTTSSTCGMLVAYPLALVRTRLQALTWLPAADQINQPDTMLGQFRHILRNEGLLGLWRGITPNLGKVIPAVSISYLVYENVRKWLGATMT